MQATIAIKFISSKDNDEDRVMQSKSDNIENIVKDKADEVMEQLFSVLLRQQIGLETSIKGGEFVFDCVNLL